MYFDNSRGSSVLCSTGQAELCSEGQPQKDSRSSQTSPSVSITSWTYRFFLQKTPCQHQYCNMAAQRHCVHAIINAFSCTVFIFSFTNNLAGSIQGINPNFWLRGNSCEHISYKLFIPLGLQVRGWGEGIRRKFHCSKWMISCNKNIDFNSGDYFTSGMKDGCFLNVS